MGTGSPTHITLMPKRIENENEYLEFLRSDESMYAYNTSQVEVIAIGNVMKVDIQTLTYMIQGREGWPSQRTQWNTYGFNPEMADDNTFSVRTTGETLKLLHEDEVHYCKLVWMPSSCEVNPCPETSESNLYETIRRTNEHSSDQSTLPRQGSLTRQRSKDQSSQSLRVRNITDSSPIIDRLVNKRK